MTTTKLPELPELPPGLAGLWLTSTERDLLREYVTAYGEACRATAPAEVAGDWAELSAYWRARAEGAGRESTRDLPELLPAVAQHLLSLDSDNWMLAQEVQRASSLLATRPAPGRDGFVMVPVEATEAMLEAARARIKEVTTIIEAGPAKGATLVREPHYNIYRAMLAAAPAPRPADPDFVRRIES